MSASTLPQSVTGAALRTAFNEHATEIDQHTAAIATKETSGVAAALVSSLKDGNTTDTIATLKTSLDTKVTLVNGKDLIATSEISRLAGVFNVDISNKVDKVTGKGLSTEDYTTIEKVRVKQTFNVVNRVGSVFNNPVPVGKFIMPQRAFSDGTSQGNTYQYWFKTAFNCTAIQFIFCNWSLGNTGVSVNEVVGLNPITISFSLYVGGLKQGYINGSVSAIIQPGGIIKTDPLPYQLTAGTNYAVRVYVSVGTMGQKWPLGLQCQTLLTEGIGTGDCTMSGTIVTSANVNGYNPIGIIAKPTSPRTYTTVGIFGDSIVDGNAAGSSTGLNLDQGWARRGLDALNIPWVKFCIGGDTMVSHMTLNGIALQLANCSGVDIGLCNYGANDLSGTMTFTQAQVAYLAYWNAIASQGIRVIQSTVMPRGTFTTAQLTVRNQINDWIRTTPAPLYAYIEVADIVETARDTNVWKAGYTADNTHPNSATESIVGAVISANSSLFLL